MSQALGDQRRIAQPSLRSAQDPCKRLHCKLWQAWPDKDPKKRGAIAEWYERLDRKLSKDVYGKPLNLKPVLWPCCNR